MRRFEDEYGQEYNNYQEIVPQLEKLVAKKKSELGM